MHHGLGSTLAWLLTVGAPDGAERAVFGTAAECLDRSPHISIVRQQIPACRLESQSADAPAIVGVQRSPLGTVFQDGCPDKVAIPLDDRMRTPELPGFFRIERGVNAAEHDVGA